MAVLLSYTRHDERMHHRVVIRKPYMATENLDESCNMYFSERHDTVHFAYMRFLRIFQPKHAGRAREPTAVPGRNTSHYGHTLCGDSRGHRPTRHRVLYCPNFAAFTGCRKVKNNAPAKHLYL
jgi:hypothetical protein